MGRVIVGGRALGPVLKSAEPINFLGTVDKNTGLVGDDAHPLYRKPMAGTVLVFPHGIGSSVGAYTIYSLKSGGTAPAAMVCKRADLTVATGCALAGIPMVLADAGEFDLLCNGHQATVDSESERIITVHAGPPGRNGLKPGLQSGTPI